MNKFFQGSFFMLALSGVVLLTSCNGDDPPLPDNTVNFESTELGLTAAETDLTVNITLAREAETDGTLTVAIASTGVTYGAEFTTEPAASPISSGPAVTVAVTAGSTTASFKVLKSMTVLFDGTESVGLTIVDASDGLVLGEKNNLDLRFSEIIATTGTMEVSGGGLSYPNQVFIDLSANRQIAVARNSWDLAFISSADQFRVLLNSSNKMMARVVDKSDLTTVTAADTVGFGAQLSLDAIFGTVVSVEDFSDLPDWVATSTSWIDDPKGDISKTAIASVSPTATDNKVYIVNRGTNGGWKKIRVIRNGSNYTLQYADISSANISSLDVTKSSTTALTYVSLTTNNVVNVAPASGSWDIAWSGLTNTTNFGPGSPDFPYYFQDMVFQNTTGVLTAQVKTSTVSYDAFNEASLANISFVSDNQINIGSSWRTTGPPPAPIGIATDLFYVIKDADGNVYKLMFTSLFSNGERGKPSFKFDLVKKGS